MFNGFSSQCGGYGVPIRFIRCLKVFCQLILLSHIILMPNQCSIIVQLVAIYVKCRDISR